MSAFSLATSPAALLDLARNARAECNVNQAKFSFAKEALDSLCMALEFHESVTTNNAGLDSSTLSSLENHLAPCQRALSGVVEIRRKYRSEMSLPERAMWRASDGKKFNEAVSELVQATNLLRSTLRMVEETQLKRKVDTPPAAANPKVTQGAHPDTPPCRYGAACNKATCAFKHPRTPLCRYGAVCKTPGCSFTHPEAIDCRYGADCASPDCSYKHHRSPACRYGADCKNENCKFAHPPPPPPYTKKPEEANPRSAVSKGRQGKGDTNKKTTKGRRAKSTVIPEKASQLA